ncbi:MAG: flagellar basal body-associated FliL family protein [Thioalkalispiraceae bacterium]|jgi:flagellar FliL protein
MADDELDLDVQTKGGKGKIVLLVVGALLLVAIAVGATLYFSGALSGDKKDGKASAEDQEKADFEPKVTLYMPLQPEFVVNFEDNSVVNYMQVEMQIMAREQRALDAVKQHMPVIRNNILLLLSTQKYQEVNTPAGKEKLRAEILNSIQQVLNQEARSHSTETEATDEAEQQAEPPKIEAVYFTSLIMQ